MLCQLFTRVVFVYTLGEAPLAGPFVGFGSFTLGQNMPAGAPGAAPAPILGTAWVADERRHVSGLCPFHLAPLAGCTTYGPSRVLSINLANLLPMPVSAQGSPMLPEGMPSVTCVDGWVRSAQAPMTRLPELCVDVREPFVVSANNTNGSVVLGLNDPSSSAATFAEDGRDYTMLHVVFWAAPVDPINTLVGVGEYSVDGGETWLTQGSLAYYEAHIDLALDDRHAQAWQYDVTMPFRVAPGERILYRVDVQDTVTFATSRLAGALVISDTVTPFYR